MCVPPLHRLPLHGAVLPALIWATNAAHLALYFGKGWESSSYPVDSQSQLQRMHLAFHSSDVHHGQPHLVGMGQGDTAC